MESSHVEARHAWTEILGVSSHQPRRLPTCSVVIATLDRLDALQVVFACLARQTVRPYQVIVSVAGNAAAVSAKVPVGCESLIEVIESQVKSSAKQRNQAAARATGEIIAFLDDDIEFGPELFETVLSHFAEICEEELAAISPRIANQGRARPGRFTLAYYRIQAGYPDPDYGGALFGPGINCFPIFDEEDEAKVKAQWLPSTCLFIRNCVFKEELFPEFDGYSFAEDVHLTARISKRAPIYFVREPTILHHSLTSEFKRNHAQLTAGKLHNMAVVARDVMGVNGFTLWWKWNFHRVFMCFVLLLRRPVAWHRHLVGIFIARM